MNFSLKVYFDKNVDCRSSQEGQIFRILATREKFVKSQWPMQKYDIPTSS